MQKKATKILPALKWLPYSERLKACQIPTLHYRRIREVMIETYKIITGKYQGCVAPSLIKEEIYVTRENDLRLQKLWVRYDLRKFGFPNRVVNKWNSLPNWVVSANTTNTFKARLDKFCTEPEVVVKCCVNNFNNLVHRKVFSRCGIESSACARKLRLRLHIFNGFSN